MVYKPYAVASYKNLVVHVQRAPYDVYVGRPTIWGNPFSHRDETSARYKVETREQAIAEFERYLLSKPALVAKVKAELRSKVLACWCDPLPCHAHVLARIANE